MDQQLSPDGTKNRQGWVIPFWAQKVGEMATIAGAVVALIIGGVQFLDIQPIATKNYVADYVGQRLDARLEPIIVAQAATTAQETQQRVDLASLTVQTLNYQLLMLTPIIQRLDAAIQAGTASPSDQALAAQYHSEITATTIARDHAACILAQSTRVVPAACP